MNPTLFQHDRHLRASGYHLLTWGFANVVLVLPVYVAALGSPWRGSTFLAYAAAVVVAVAILLLVNERRVAKMCGPLPEGTLFDAGRLWATTIALGLVLTITLQTVGLGLLVPPVWMLVVGASYLIWGAYTVPAYAWLGMTTLIAGAAALAGQSLSSTGTPWLPGLHLWCATMGAGFLAAATVVNSRYLWRPAEQSVLEQHG